MRSINLSIRTIVPPTISAEPFRLAMIAIIFIRHILSLFSSLSVFLSNLTVPVAAYFSHPIGSATRETERIVDSIRLVFFHIDNFQDIEFLDFSNKSALVSDLAHHATVIVFFTFRSTVTASDVDTFSFDHLIT